MPPEPNKALTQQVKTAMASVLARDGVLTYPTLLIELGYMLPRDQEAWRSGQVPYLEQVVRANLTKLARIQTAVRRQARAQGLVRLVQRQPNGRRYSKNNHPFVETEYNAVYREES